MFTNKIVKYILLFALVQIQVFQGFSQDIDLLFQEGNKLYHNNKYDSALLLYDSIENQGILSENLYLNKGNTYYKLNDFPSAILNYERAKKINPGSEETNTNLELANLRITDKIEPVPEVLLLRFWRSILLSFSSTSWSVFLIASMWLIAILVIIFLVASKTSLKKILLLVIGINITVSILLFIFSSKRHQQEDTQEYAIIFNYETSLKSAPDNTSSDLYIIHGGLKILLLESIDDWTRVKLSDGKIGWLKNSSYTKI